MSPSVSMPLSFSSAKQASEGADKTAEQTGQVHIILIGTSFKSASLPVREAIDSRISRSTSGPVDLPDVIEYAELKTCNRIEMVFTTKRPEHLRDEVLSWQGTASPESFYVRMDMDAIAHLFRVASGLESMVLGEDQILAQVRDAGIAARKAGTSKGILSSLFDAAGSVGRKTRTSLDLVDGSRSVSAFALRFALEKLGSRPKKVLLVGSGKTIKLAASQLSDAKLYMATRRRVTRYHGAKRVTRSELVRVAEQCDLIISATQHSGYLIKAGSLPTRKRRVVLDLAFPRNIDPKLGRGRTSLYNLDDLAAAAAEMPSPPGTDRADRLVLEEAERFSRWLVASRLTTTLSNLHQWAEAVRVEETKAALRRMPGLSERERKLIEVMSRRLVSKLMASPTKFAKASTPDLSQEDRLDAIDRVFGRDGGRS